MLRRLLQEIGKGKLLLLWGLSLLFGLSERTGQNSSLSLHTLGVLNDQYYFIFAVLPIFLLFCASVMEDDEPSVLMRYGACWRYFFAKWWSLVILSVLLWLGQILVILISGLGLPISGGWISNAGYKAEIFQLFQGVFSSPAEAVLGCAGYLLLGYCMIGMTTLWLGHFCQRSLAVKLLMALYLLAVAWIKVPVMSSPPFVYMTSINHWVLLLHNLTSSWRPAATAGTTLIIIVGMVWTIRFKWKTPPNTIRGGQKGLAPYYRRLLFSKQNVLMLMAVIFSLPLWSWLRSGPPENTYDWILRLFAGHGTGYFYPMGFMFLLVMDVLPLWALCILLERTIGERPAFLTIRLTRRRELMQAILSTAFLWVLFCGCLLAAAAVIPPLMLDLPIDGWLTLSVVVLKLLDIGLQFLLILVILCLTGHTTVGFIAVVLMHFLCILPIPWLPVGLSSILRLSLPHSDGIIPLSSAGLLLFCLVCGLILWLYNLGTKRLFNH